MSNWLTPPAVMDLIVMLIQAIIHYHELIEMGIFGELAVRSRQKVGDLGQESRLRLVVF